MATIPDPPTPAARRHSRANWVGLRTLRQIPKVVGETAVGEPIYEAQSVRLVLRAGAAHFNRIVACAECGSDVPGSSVLSPADLEHTPSPLICKGCAETVSAGVPPVERATSDVGDPGTPPPDTGVPAAAERASVDGARLAVLERRSADLAEKLESHRAELQAALDGRIEQTQAEIATLAARAEELARAHDDRLEQLHATFSSEAIRAGAAVDRVVQGSSELREAQAEIGRRLEELADRLPQNGGTTSVPAHALDARLQALEHRLEETVERLTERDEVQAELRVVLEGRVDQLAAALERDGRPAEGGVAPIGSEKQALATAQSDSAALAQVKAELATVEELLNQRLDRMAEKAARVEEAEAERVRALEERVENGLQRIEKAVESSRRDLKTGLRKGLAEVQAAIPAPASVSDSRIKAVEERLERSDHEMSELGELHAALDVGLGALRSEIAEVRNAVKRVTGQQADIQDRLEDSNRPLQAAAPVDPGRGRKPGRKAEAGHLAVAIEAAEVLAREHQQLKAQVAELEKAAEAAAATAARASSLATASGPLRSDVRTLQEQLEAQNDAIANLSRSVDRLRRKVSAPAAAEPDPKPAPKPARKATKRPPR